MDLRSYLEILRKHAVIIILLALFGLTLGAARYLTATRVYTSSMQFYVSTLLSEQTNPAAADQFAQNRVNTYVNLLGSRGLAQRLIDQTGVDLSSKLLSSRIEASAQIGTVLIDVRVSDTDRARADELAEELVDVFIEMVDELDNPASEQPVVTVNLVSAPGAAVQTSPDRDRLLVAGLALGLVLGGLYALARELLDKSLHSPQALAEMTGQRVISEIPLPAADSSGLLLTGYGADSPSAEALRRLRAVVHQSADRHRVSLFTAPSDVESSALIAVSLAMQLTSLEQKVLLVDANLRKSEATELLGLPISPGLGELLDDATTLDRALVERQSDGLWVLPSGESQNNPADLLAMPDWGELLAELRTRFEHVVISTPGLLPYTDALVAGTHTDEVFMVVSADHTQRDEVRTSIDALASVSAPLRGLVWTAETVNERSARRAPRDRKRKAAKA